MLGIIVFVVALLAMFVWFGYLFARDPANLFKREERAQRRRDFGLDPRDDTGGNGTGRSNSSDGGDNNGD